MLRFTCPLAFEWRY